MSPNERAVIDKLVEAWNSFLTLPTEHPDEQTEFRLAVHNAQRIVMVRSVRRELNG
jgi:hypothetical protein